MDQKKDEAVTFGLRTLFELRGFTQVRVNKFEDYDICIENRNFLDSDNVITFMDMDGRLKCMKPDVTLSVVKNIPGASLSRCEKLYYIDEVCRVSRESREYKMLGQIGVELIGPDDPFVSLETVDLALESLAVIGGNYVLDLSHLGFVSGLLDTVAPGRSGKVEIMRALHTKSPHTAVKLLNDQNVSEDDKERVLKMGRLSGNIMDILPRAKALISSDQMRDAYMELEMFGQMLSKCGMAERVNLDFSVVNDLDYYNGLIFHGYVEGLPDAVLTGGRYDNLMKKMGKRSGAIGFAVFLSELNTYFKSGETHDFDVLIRYKDGCDYPKLLAIVREMTAQGKSTRLENESSVETWICKEHYRFDNKGLRRDTAGNLCKKGVI